MIPITTGLSPAEILQSRSRFGTNGLPQPSTSVWQIVWRQVNNPILAVLAVTTLVAFFFDDHANAAIIFGILVVSVIIGFWNEYTSERSIARLQSHIHHATVVVRSGEKVEIPVDQLVLGDIVLLSQGTVIPADLELIDARSLQVSEAALTGESEPLRKAVDPGDESRGWVRMGSVVVGGSGKAVVRRLARDTEFGTLASHLTKAHAPTSFQKGLSKLSSLMTRVIVVMAVLLGILNILLGKDVLQAILFSLSIAIGLTPALLPVIITVCMAKGASRMAKHGVVVKRLVSIEDFGSMNVLCTDKTGTLTEGAITLTGYQTAYDRPERYVLEMAMVCTTASVHHRILGTPIDVAILEYARDHRVPPLRQVRRLAEEEFNFEHRGQFTVIKRETERLLVFKGAPDETLSRCSHYRNEQGKLVPIKSELRAFRRKFHLLNEQGLRLVLVAQRSIGAQPEYGFGDAQELELLGYLTFLDTPKHSAKHAMQHLRSLGVAVKIVTGDNEIVTGRICQELAIPIDGIITGPGLERMDPHEKRQAVQAANIFARVSPLQKEEIVTLLRQAGNTVGYMGDGINDAGALRAADVSISVNSAVDVAKQQASVVLLRKGLDVIADGVEEGRRIIQNTIKYILMGVSSNFGNMFSMAGASLFFSFLPMTPSQILLNTSLYDISQLAIPGDRVDDSALAAPQSFDIGHIYQAMLYFGPLSSLFDYVTFFVLWFGFRASEQHFQTGWFLLSLVSQVLVVFVIRTQVAPFWKSRPSLQLVLAATGVVAVAVWLPYSPLAHWLRLVPLSPMVMLALAAVAGLYLILVDMVKQRLLARILRAGRKAAARTVRSHA